MGIFELITIFFTFCLSDRFFYSKIHWSLNSSIYFFILVFTILNVVFNEFHLLSGYSFLLYTSFLYIFIENITGCIYNEKFRYRIVYINSIRIFIYMSIILFIYSKTRLS